MRRAETLKTAAPPVLQVDQLTVRYGNVVAVDGLDLTVASGEVFAVLGANGAGKTSTLRALSRLVSPSGGSVRLSGRSLDGVSAHAAARRGVRHVPEGRRVFPAMTVAENLELGGIGRSRAEVRERRDWAYSVFPRLRERSGQLAGSLSGGEQQMLAIGRALMREPAVLLLDEPSLGLSPEMVFHIYQALGALKSDGVAMVLVEQNAEVALRFADRGCVLSLGRVVHEGTADELAHDADLLSAYLGGAETAEAVDEPVVVTEGGFRRMWRI